MHTSDTDDEDAIEMKIEKLSEIICRTGDETSAAFFVLMGTLANSTHPRELANIAKHLAFNRCVELNLYGMVDAQLAVIEGELLASNTLEL
jgi:hypothetical protein